MDARSAEFSIGEYPAWGRSPLFMRQQRCGYNPFLDMVCHRRDGRFYAPFPDETFVDASGGWHDAGDQLKYLITASNATARMILAYEAERHKFIDAADSMGRDDRPKQAPTFSMRQSGDSTGYINYTHRPISCSTRSRTTVIIAGSKCRTTTTQIMAGVRTAIVRCTSLQRQAAGSRAVEKPLNRRGKYRRSFRGCDGDGISCWKTDLKDPQFARKCLRAAETLYVMGKRQEGYQQGNSFKTPYRYNEDVGGRYGICRGRALRGDESAGHFSTTRNVWQSSRAQLRGWNSKPMTWDSRCHGTIRCILSRTSGIFRCTRWLINARGLNSPVTIAAVSRKSSHEQERESLRRRCSLFVVLEQSGGRVHPQVHLYEKMTGDRRYHNDA